jgi:hypothetical protein
MPYGTGTVNFNVQLKDPNFDTKMLKMKQPKE